MKRSPCPDDAPLVHVLVYQRQTLHVPDSQVARLRRWPRWPRVEAWTVRGFLVDAAIAGHIAYRIVRSLPD